MSKKILTGKVVSARMQKTAVIAIETIKAHPLYKKRIRRTKTYKAHNSIGAKEGDTVLIEESKPFSKDKRWSIFKIG